ncbi:hypothetical protein CHELA40_14926 [Chelatococcus asaccharovorans]|nr:hypothetical protein CHELA17_60696 [Chelatococcus asaccharovorans]CAH1680802.1 hypothetical protein CHELA40_14926 [Chelatococcus asaccharovorans]
MRRQARPRRGGMRAARPRRRAIGRRRPVSRGMSISRQQPSRARFDLIASDRRSNFLYFKHNLIDPRFTPVGLCSRANFDLTGSQFALHLCFVAFSFREPVAASLENALTAFDGHKNYDGDNSLMTACRHRKCGGNG